MLTALWMKKDVISIDKETTIAQAKEIFDHNHIRHLPVLDEKMLVGIVTLNDMHKALPSALNYSHTSNSKVIADETKISTVMTVNPFTAHPMDPLENIALAMRRFKINAVPVVEDNLLVGLITIADICYAFAETLGAKEPCTRIELQVDKNSKAIYKVIELCSDFEMDIFAITLYRNYSADHQLVTIKAAGENMDEMIGELWDVGVKVNQIIKEG